MHQVKKGKQKYDHPLLMIFGRSPGSTRMRFEKYRSAHSRVTRSSIWQKQTWITAACSRVRRSVLRLPWNAISRGSSPRFITRRYC